MPGTDESIKLVTERRHPRYDALIDHWDFCELSYRGGRGYMTSKNIFRYYKEGPKDYEDRLARTHRANHTKRVVDTVNLHLFKQPVERDEQLAPEELKRFWLDPAGNGKTSISTFAKQMDQWQSVYGRIYVLVDNTDFGVVSLKDAEQISKPYAYIIHPQSMLDMAFDAHGEFLWALVVECRREDRDPFTSNGREMHDIRLWMRDEWHLFLQRLDPHGNTYYERGPSGVNRLGVVPIVAIESEEGDAYSAPAMIGDIVDMDRTIVNYGSVLDEIIYGQTFSQLAIPAAGVEAGTTGYNNSVVAARDRVFLFDNSDGNSAPFYISPDAGQADLIIKAMSVLMRNIYSVTGTDNEANGQSQSKGKEYASGVVREFDYGQIENLLLNKSRALEVAEEKIAKLVLKYAGITKTDDEIRQLIKYPNQFDVRGLESDLGVAKMLSDLEAPDELMRPQLKIAAGKMLPRQTTDDKAKIESAIDNWKSKGQHQRDTAEKNFEETKRQADRAAVAAAVAAKNKSTPARKAA